MIIMVIIIMTITIIVIFYKYANTIDNSFSKEKK